MARSNRGLWLLGFLMIGVAAATPIQASDHILTIGGGSSASNNQVSLEKNVLFLQRYLAAAGMGNVPHEILFSDGKAGARDLQYSDPNFQLPRVNDLLAQVFNRGRDLTTQYRAHAIPNLWGASGRLSIGKWFDTIGTKLEDGDRLLIYFTGHGGPGQGRPPVNQTLAMWNEPDMAVHEFAGLLDRLPSKVSVVLVMVQCFGGGFANVIYNDADPNKGLSPRDRSGFFATIPTRFAAGCTADADEENYKEYSTYFWAALYGQKRTGEAIKLPDYDGDGKVSLAEAHAYALIASETVDISIKTSDVFLRRYSSFRADGVEGMVTAEIDFDRLLALSDPSDRAVLKELSAVLKLEGKTRVRDARSAADGIAQQRKSIEQRRNRLSRAHDQMRGVLQARVTGRWPELSNLLHPGAEQIITTHGDEVVKFIEAAPQFKEFSKQEEEIDDLDNQSTELERTWVKQQRFIRTAGNVALAANLPKVAKGEIQDRYERLIKAESGWLGAEK